MTLLDELVELVKKYGYEPKAGGIEVKKEQCEECEETGAWCKCHLKYK